MDLELLVLQLQAAGQDRAGLAERLAVMLQRALPEQVKVTRSWGILGGRVTEIMLNLGSLRYRFDFRGASPTVHRQSVVQGIAVGMGENLPAAAWPRELAHDLERSIEENSISGAALERMLHNQ